MRMTAEYLEGGAQSNAVNKWNGGAAQAVAARAGEQNAVPSGRRRPGDTGGITHVRRPLRAAAPPLGSITRSCP